MGGTKINICIGLSIFILSACITLHQDIYKSSPSKYIKILSDSTFIFWADSPLLFGEQTDRYSDGRYCINNSTIIFNSIQTEIKDSFEAIEYDNKYSPLVEGCSNLLITIKFLRSQYPLPIRMNVSAISLDDSISISSYSDSIILLQCKNDSLAKRLSNEIMVYNIPYKIHFQKLVFSYLNKSYIHFLTDSINHLDIIVYEKEFDTLEFRTFRNEKWKIHHNRLIDPITKEEYILWKPHSKEQKNMKIFYDNIIKESYIFNHYCPTKIATYTDN